MSGLADRLKSLDAHSSVSNEFRVRTAQGAAFSVVTLLAISYLIYTELIYNLTSTVLDRVHVNATSSAGLEMEFDVTFPKVPCALLSVDANDPTGQAQSLHIDRSHRVYKHRIDKNGRLVGRKSRFEVGGTFQSEEHLMEFAKNVTNLEEEGEVRDEGEEEDGDEEECGSCYGAGEEGECCNTCDDVKRVYQRQGWVLRSDALKTIKQCLHEVKSDDEQNEGCNVHGFVALSSGGGNLHLAPGRGLEKFGEETTNAMQSLADFIMGAFEQFNVSHTVHKLRFGHDYPGNVNQLDGAVRNIEDGYGMYQYYIQVVPTLYRYLDGTTVETNQYSVTEHMRHVNPGTGRGLPGVFFFYEVSALHVEIEEYRRGWIHFFTSVCAIVGGVVTVMGMADKFVYAKFVDKDQALAR